MAELTEETKAQATGAALTPQINHLRIDAAAILRLQEELGVSQVLAQALVSRGLEDARSAADFLDPQMPETAPKLGAIDSATQRIVDAISNNEQIVVHGDYDSDGVCSTALLTRGLRGHGADVTPLVPEREQGYGLSQATVETIAGRGCKLLIAVDCGITAVEEVALAKRLGVDSIVVDHHRPRSDGQIPQALLVHPQLEDPDALPLCATAIAGFLLDRLDQMIGVADPASDGRKELSAIATVTDVMPLIGINRAIVARGLRELPSTQLVGLAALIRSSGTDPGSITSRTLGFAIGPRLNAAGRVQAAAAALDLLLTDDPDRAVELANQLEAANTERRAIQMDVRVAAEIQAAELGGTDAYVLAGEGWHPGVIGIVAGNIARERHRPTVVLSINGDSAVGSVRSVPGYNVAAALDRVGHLLTRHGGHMAAAGLTIDREKIDQFRDEFASDVAKTLSEELKRPVITVDAYVAPAQLNLVLAEDLARLEPSGEGNRSPVLCVPSVQCESPRKMGGGKHVRLTLRSGDTTAAAVAFNMVSPTETKWGERADVFGALEINEWKGRVEPRFNVSHIGAPQQLGVQPAVGASRTLDELFLPDPLLEEPAIGGEPRRVTLDMTAAGPAVAIAALAGEGNRVCALVADVSRRLEGLGVTHGNLALVDWEQFRSQSNLIAPFDNVLVLDPPNNPSDLELAARQGSGTIALAWRSAEIQFAAKIFEEALDINSRIRPLYSALRDQGEDAFALLSRLWLKPEKGGSSPRAVRLMVGILLECGLLEVDKETKWARTVHQKTDLNASARFVSAAQELAVGRRFRTALMERHP